MIVWPMKMNVQKTRLAFKLFYLYEWNGMEDTHAFEVHILHFCALQMVCPAPCKRNPQSSGCAQPHLLLMRIIASSKCICCGQLHHLHCLIRYRSAGFVCCRVINVLKKYVCNSPICHGAPCPVDGTFFPSMQKFLNRLFSFHLCHFCPSLPYLLMSAG